MLPPLSFIKRPMLPPRYYDFPEELVVDGGIKTLGLHLRATCRERSTAHFGLHLLDLHITMYTSSLSLSKERIICT